jgi:hypothetical protein
MVIPPSLPSESEQRRLELRQRRGAQTSVVGTVSRHGLWLNTRETVAADTVPARKLPDVDHRADCNRYIGVVVRQDA